MRINLISKQNVRIEGRADYSNIGQFVNNYFRIETLIISCLGTGRKKAPSKLVGLGERGVIARENLTVRV
jgi:hypothetical protein